MMEIDSEKEEANVSEINSELDQSRGSHEFVEDNEAVDLIKNWSQQQELKYETSDFFVC